MGQEPESFAARISREDSYSLELITGASPEGKEEWSVLLVQASRVGELSRALSSRQVVLEEFGEVLATGEGSEPPEELMEELRALITRK